MLRHLHEGYYTKKGEIECLLKKSNCQKKRDFSKTILREMVEERMGYRAGTDASRGFSLYRKYEEISKSAEGT